MATDIFGASPQTDLRRRWALLQLQQAQDTSPVKHPLQAVARAMQGAFGGYAGYQAEQENKAGADKMFDAVLGSGSPNPALERVQPAMSEAQPSGDPASAIAKIESGGAYDKLGPVINRGSMVGDRAYGKYQVMGSNVGPWTEKYLGQRLTPDQFVQNPQAQDAVFKGEFGRLSQRHGPEGAARAWFAGEGGMNKPNRTDQLGTSVAAYGQKFTRAMGPQMASLGNGMPANDTPAPPAGPQMAQATPPQPVRSQPQVPPEVREQINRLRAIGTPQANQAAWGLALQYMKPMEPKYSKFDDEHLFDEKSGAIRPAGPGYKSLTDPAERAKYGIPAEDKRPYQVRGGKLINPPPETRINNNVGGGSDKQIFDTMDEGSKAARTAAVGLTGLREARAAIQSGAITGAMANQSLGLQKIGAALGLANSDKIVNTETFRAAIAPQISAVLKSTVGTTNISNTDREFAEKAAGGNITLDERSITRLLDIMERASIAQLEGHAKRLEKVYPDAEKYARERALFGVDMPAVIPPAPPPAPSDWQDMGGGVRIRERR
jgi:hypothetical protein